MIFAPDAPPPRPPLQRRFQVGPVRHASCPNGDAATAIDAYVVRGGYADVAELAAAARAFDAVEGEDRGVPTAS